MIEIHDEQSVELAVIMSCPPEQIDQMNYLDSLSFFTAWAKKHRRDRQFEAAVHGRELR